MRAFPTTLALLVLVTLTTCLKASTFGLAPTFDGIAGGGSQQEATPRHRGAETQIDLEKLGQYLRAAATRSLGRSYEEGYLILQSSLEAVWQFGPFPAGIHASLTGALNGAAAADDWKDAWETLYDAVKSIGEDPHAYAGGEESPFRKIVQLARKCALRKSYRNGTKTLQFFLESIQARPVLFENGYQRAFVKAAYEAGRSPREWEDAWRQMNGAAEAFTKTTGDPRTRYLKAALQGSLRVSFHNAAGHLRDFVTTLLSSGICDPFDKVTLEASLRASLSVSHHQAAYEILRDGIQSLL